MTPASVPSAIFTPASSANLKDARIRGAMARALAATGGGLDHGPHLLLTVLLQTRRVRERQHAARRANLDHIRAVLHHVPHGVAHFVHAVGDALLDADPRLGAEQARAQPVGCVAVAAPD